MVQSHKLIKYLLVGLVAALITFAFTMQNGSAEAASVKAPYVETTYEITKYANGSDYRFDLYTGVCLEEGAEGECAQEEVTPDLVGPILRAADVQLRNRVKQMPSGWDYCKGDDAHGYIYQSIHRYEQYNLVKVPAFSWADFDVFAAAGDGNFYDPVSNSYTLPTYVRYLPDNAKKVSYQGYAYICGPDATTPSGNGWRLLIGKPITLPAMNRW